jgi:uncharacterized protein YfiM (DUF2279 family)
VLTTTAGAQNTASQRLGNAPVRVQDVRALLLYAESEFSSFPHALLNEAPQRSLLSPPATPSASAADPWLGRDKLLHLVFSGLWTVSGQYTLVNKAGLSERQALPVSAGFTAALGFGKELYDRHRGPTRLFSKKDLVADGLGILLAAGFILL